MRIQYYLLFVFFISCSQVQIPDELKTSFKLAGENSKELKKVLRHYRFPKDSLKLKAAIFLIKNMEGKTSYADRRYERTQELIASYKLISITYKERLAAKRKELYQKLNKIDESRFKQTNDLETLSAKEIIENIDNAFIAWRMPWSAENVSFNQFCRFVLPYKIANEPYQQEWRGQVWSDFQPLIDSLQSANASMYDVAVTINRQVGISFDAYSKAAYPPRFSYSDLKQISIGSCLHASSYTIYILRALGIPISYNYVKFFGNRSSNHGWVAVHLTDTTVLPFDPAYDFKFFHTRFNPKIDKINMPPAEAIITKVYRDVFENQYHIDGELRARLLGLTNNTEDVTHLFSKASDINITFNNLPRQVKNVVLLVYKSANWVPVSISDNHMNNSYGFKKLGRRVVYLPAVINSNSFIPVGNPFILDSIGTIKPIIIKTSLEKVHLKRKFPISVRMISSSERLIGGVFQASNSPDFSDVKYLYEITQRPGPYFHTITLNLKEGFRYYRYCAPDSCYGDIAELEFYPAFGSEAVYGRPIGSLGSDGKNGVEKAFDKNKVSYFNAEERCNIWVGMEFEKPILINKIRYLPRNDLNTIEVGDLYELFYWDNNWISLGQQRATKQYLEYQAPKGALLWLRNLSGGKEERPFTYENNKQIWW